MSTESGDWAAVAIAVRARTRELKITTAELARQTGLSETTIRCLGQPGKHNRAALTAISAVLRWRFDYLLNILHGEPHKNVHINPPASVVVERIMRAEVTPLADRLDSLAEAVEAINKKFEDLASTAPPPGSGRQEG